GIGEQGHMGCVGEVGECLCIAQCHSPSCYRVSPSNKWACGSIKPWFKKNLGKDSGENRASWSDKLDDALWAFRTAFKTPIGCTLYKLVYGKAFQLNELNELRDQAYENSLIYKEKTKRLHDSKIKDRIFNVGDRVVLFNSRLKIFSRKLKTRWSGPFTITQVFLCGTVDLSQTDGPNFKLSIHDEEETKEEESFDLIPKTPENLDDEGNDDENLGLNVGSEEGKDAEDDEDELYRDININMEGRVVQMADVHTKEFEETHLTLTLVNLDGQLKNEAQAENEVFLKNLDENIQKIVKEQVKEQVKALVEAYESDKIILETYGDIVTLKIRRDDDANKDEEPFAGSDQGSKRRREGKEPDESAPAEEPMQTTQDLEAPSHQEFEIGAAADQPIAEAAQHPECDLAKQANSRSSLNELMDTHVDFSAFLMNRLKVDTLTLELLAGLTYKLMKGSCLHFIPFDHFINNDLEYLCGGASSRKYTTSVTKKKGADYEYIKWIEDLVPRTIWIQESIVEWHNYKHLDWITVCRDDDKLYKRRRLLEAPHSRH
nr:reverse transcriptase domain-containing protein [Tanacetum cinerariifolium]